MKDKSIGQNIKYYRLKNKLTQVNLAERIGVSFETLGRIERGIYGITLDNLIKISKELNVSLDNLVFGKDYCSANSKPDNLTTALGPLDEKERELFRNILQNIVNIL